MRAATVRDGEIVVAEHADPQPGAGEVLVRVRAAGLNGADMLQRAGAYPAPPGSPPDIPGLELAGEVAELGAGARRFAQGDRVMAVVGGGGQAELAVVHERQLMPVPEALDWPAAGGVPEVGTAAIQLGRATGASVVATVRDRARHAEVAALGADVIGPDGFAEHGPFDVVLELVGAPNLSSNLEALAPGGRVVVIGVGAGAKGELNLLAVMGKRARISGSTLRPRPLEEKALTARLMERHVLPLLARGEVRVPVSDSFPLDRAADAYERFAAGGKLGKIVLLTS